MRRIAGRKFREEAIHEYRFIICDGNGAASRGNEDNGYFERIVDASNLKSAVIMIFRYLNYDKASLKNYLDIYYGDDPDNEKPEFETGEEILDWVEEHNRVNWEPWVEGYAIDDKIIKDPSQMRKVIYESRISRVTADSYFAIDYDFWGVKFYDEEEEGERDYTWGYIPTYEEISHKFPDLGTAAIVATVNYLTSELAKASREKGNFFFKDKADFEKCTPQMMISILKEVRKSLLSGEILTHYELRDRRTKLEAVDEAIESLQNSKNEDLEEAKRMTARRFREAKSYIYAGINHDDANEFVKISNHEFRGMEYVDKCLKDPNNTYLVACTDEEVEICPYSYILKEINQAVEDVKAGYYEIDNIPYGYMCFEDEDEAQAFLDDPEGTYKEIVNNSYTDCDSSAGVCIFKINEDGSLEEIANGDLDLYSYIDDEEESPVTLGDWLIQTSHREGREVGDELTGPGYDTILFERYFYDLYKEDLERMGAKLEEDGSDYMILLNPDKKIKKN